MQENHGNIVTCRGILVVFLIVNFVNIELFKLYNLLNKALVLTKIANFYQNFGFLTTVPGAYKFI